MSGVSLGIKVKIPNKLKIKLSKYNFDIIASQLANKVANDALANVKIYGEGANGGFQEPYGGAPVWQGAVTVAGHYAGYLSDTHYIKRESPTHVQIVSPSGFAYGVIIGQSTNWITRDGGYYVFRPNPYHKRAVDKIHSEGRIQANWKSIVKGSLS